MIFAAVGTFIKGFDDLVLAADAAAAALDLAGFAQIGHSAVVPRRLDYARFLAPDDLGRRLRACHVLVCHAGMGLIGDGLRAGCHVVLLPRAGPTGRDHPANDQTGFARRVAERFGLRLCSTPTAITAAVAACLERPRPGPAPPASDVPEIVAAFLRGECVRGPSRPARCLGPCRAFTVCRNMRCWRCFAPQGDVVCAAARCSSPFRPCPSSPTLPAPTTRSGSATS